MIALLLAAPRLLAMDGFVLGEYANGAWTEVAPPATRLTNAGRLVWTPASLSRVAAKPLVAGLESEPDGYAGVYLRPTVKPHNGDVTGVHLSGAKPRRPRPIELLPTTDRTYRAILRRWLDRQGMRKSPPRITLIARADLDGDGTKEVLIEARTGENLYRIGFGIPNNDVDYSLVLLRATQGGKVVETPVRFSRTNGPQGSASDDRLRAIADLDGDGRMEIIVGYRAWEAFGGELYAYRAGRLTNLLRNGSGV